MGWDKDREVPYQLLSWQKILSWRKLSETLEQVALGGGGCPILRNNQGQVEQDSDQPDLFKMTLLILGIPSNTNNSVIIL